MGDQAEVKIAFRAANPTPHNWQGCLRDSMQLDYFGLFQTARYI